MCCCISGCTARWNSCPGKQAGLGARDWPDRLIGELPNVYLYASNNPSEATLAKRRSNAVTITHLTPPLAASGLYKGLAELKDSLTRWRGLAPDAAERTDLAALIEPQAEAVDLAERDPDKLWLTLLETEDALIPDGLHVVGRPIGEAERRSTCASWPRPMPRPAPGSSIFCASRRN
jgi:magnesium chelatase subunit H